MRLILPSSLGVQLVEHAVRSLPNEAVGFLAGREGVVQRTLPLRNIAGQNVFLADPFDQFTAERAIQSGGLELLAIYHSHPDGCACLSDLDLALAAPWNCAQLVIALDTNGKTVHIRAHRIEGSSHEAVEILCPGGQIHAGRITCELNTSGCEQHPAR